MLECKKCKHKEYCKGEFMIIDKCYDRSLTYILRQYEIIENQKYDIGYNQNKEIGVRHRGE